MVEELLAFGSWSKATISFPGIIPVNNLGEPLGPKAHARIPIPICRTTINTNKTKRINANFVTSELDCEYAAGVLSFIILTDTCTVHYDKIIRNLLYQLHRIFRIDLSIF